MSDKKMRWSDRNARPSGCVVTVLAGMAATFVACWPIAEALT